MSREESLKTITRLSALRCHEISKDEEVAMLHAFSDLAARGTYLADHLEGAAAHFERLCRQDLCEPMARRIGQARVELKGMTEDIMAESQKLSALREQVQSAQRELHRVQKGLEDVREQARDLARR